MCTLNWVDIDRVKTFCFTLQKFKLAYKNHLWVGIISILARSPLQLKIFGCISCWYSVRQLSAMKVGGQFVWKIVLET